MAQQPKKQRHIAKEQPAVVAPVKKTVSGRTAPAPGFIHSGAQMPKWIYGLIVALCFVYFGNTLFNEYALDDTMVLTQNEFVKRGVSNIPKIFKYDTFIGRYGEQVINLPGGRYRPLSVATLAVEYDLFVDADTKQEIVNKLDHKQNDDDAPLLVKTPLPYVNHFMNIMYYAATACLLLLIMLRLFPLKSNAGWGLLFNVPVLTVIFFLAHPVHSEVVANIKGRDEIMTLLGAMGGLWFTLRWLDTSKLKYLAYSFLAFLAGLFSKENAITFLVVIPLTVYFFTNYSMKRNLVSMLPLLGATLIFLACRASAINSDPLPETELMNNPFMLMTGSQKWASIIYVLGRYLWLTIFPYPLTTDYYPYHIPIMNWSDFSVILITLLYVAIGLFILWGIYKKNKYAYAAIWYYVPLSIVSNIFVQVGTFMNERFIYISSIGFCMVLADLLILQAPKWIKNEKIYRNAVTGFVCLILCLYATDAISRNRAWHDDFTLSTTDVKVSYNSAKSNYDAARVYNIELQKTADPARRDTIIRLIYNYSHRAVDIHPNYENALLLLAWSNSALGYSKDTSVHYLMQLLRRNPYNPYAIDALTMTLGDAGTAKREAIWAQVVRLAPNRFEANYNYACVLGKEESRYADALPYFEKAVNLNPENATAMIDLGFVYGMNNYPVKALEAFKRAAQLAPMDTLAWKNLFATYNLLGDQPKAQDAYNRYMQVKMTLQQQQQPQMVQPQ